MAIALGVLSTAVEVYVYFKDQNNAAKKNIERIIANNYAPASKAVRDNSAEAVEQILSDIASYPFVQSVEIVSENGNPFAAIVKPHQTHRYSAITVFFTSSTSVHKTTLDVSLDDPVTALEVTIDNNVIYQPVYSRVLYALTIGLIRNITLALAFYYLFNTLLSRPLAKIASNIALFSNGDSGQSEISHIDGHREDEIGAVVNSVNKLIQQFDARQTALSAREHQLRIILDASPNQVFAIDREGTLVYANVAAAAFYGIDEASIIGRNYYDIHRQCSEKETEELFNTIKSIERSNDAKRDIKRSLTSTANVKHIVNMIIMPFNLNDRSCILVIASNISERVAAEARVERMAYYDGLTGLPNRNKLYEILIDHISDTKRRHREGAVLFIDIDDFKRINDTLGHSIGDALLVTLSDKMRAVLKPNEVLARLGGDEFILSMPSLSDCYDDAAIQASDLAKKLLNLISSPIELDTHSFAIGASIGISTYPSIAKDTEQLLQFADTAMYQAKAAGRNCYRVFERPMADEARARIDLESEIRHAINHQEFLFYLQPLISAATGKIQGAEALIRWQHPVRGLILPNQFIPYLEQSPMVNQVGAQILDQVCGFLAVATRKGLIPDEFRVSVNISATEFFQQNFVERTKAVLDTHGIDGKYLELEITESIAIDGLDNVVTTMNELQKHNITFALDDFGTGYSSLNYLKQLPVDKIKIDKTFIDDVPDSQQDTSLVEAVLDIADNLKLNVVVEGVEHEHQAKYFSTKENVIAQGYYFDAPMPADELTDKYLG